MSNILFITSKFLPYADANGICVSNIIKALQKEKHSIFCICEREPNQSEYEVIDGVGVYRVNATLITKMTQIYNEHYSNFIIRVLFRIFRGLRTIKNMFILPFFPNVSPIRSRNIYKLFERINRDQEIDCVIGVFRPYEGIKVATKVKECYPKIICIAYYLDLIRGVSSPKFMPHKLYHYLCDRNEQREFRKLDAILLPVNGKPTYDKILYDFAREKIKYVDFPLYVNEITYIEPDDIKENKSCNAIYQKEHINIIYAGFIDNENRNPKYFLHVLSKAYNKNKNIRFHIYGTNNCPNVISDFKDKYPELINYHGKVSYSTVLDCIFQADFTVNITNKTTPQMVPSKIFQLFAAGKPIINIVNSQNDCTVHYFEKYPLVCNLYEYKGNLEKDAEALNIFLENEWGSKANLKDIGEKYYANKPEYTADIIKELINAIYSK